MKVTHKTITRRKEVNKDTKYIIYFPGNAEDVDLHSPSYERWKKEFGGQDMSDYINWSAASNSWNWCDDNTVIDLCNHPYHSEWHNPDVLGRSKFRSIAYNIITLASFTAAIAALYLFTPLALAIPASIFLSLAFVATMVFVNSVIVRSNAKFYLRGEDSVAVGVKRVLDLLEKGVDPDNIILHGQSIGGGVAAKVYKKFESEGIHLRCQISTSFSSIADVFIPMDGNDDDKKQSFLKRILKIGHWDIETYKIINSITPYTMFFNNEGDQVIKKEAQLVTKVRKMEQNGKKKSSQAPKDKIFEILFKKHTMLGPNDIGRDNLQSCGNNTHCFPLVWLESTESSDISAKDLHYLFTYLPYHMNVLHTEVANFMEGKSYSDYTGNHDKERTAELLHNLLNTLNGQERGELKSLLGELKKRSCLTENQNYSLETCKKGLEKLKQWVRGYDISFVDLDNPKTPGGSLIMHTSNPCVKLPHPSSQVI